MKESINNCLNFSDNVPTIRLGSWLLNSALFEGERTAGPCPLLFSPDIGAAEAAISADPARAHLDLQRIYKIFFCAEDASLKEALSLVKKPR